MNSILRRALGAAAITAAAAAGTYFARKLVDRQRTRRGRRAEERLDVSRWEGEGGAPPDLTAAVPHHDVATH